MDVDLSRADTVPRLTDKLPGHVPGDGGELQPARLPPDCLNPLESLLAELTPPDLRPGVSLCPTVNSKAGSLRPVEVRVWCRLADGGGLQDSQTVSHRQGSSGPLQLTGVVTWTPST